MPTGEEFLELVSGEKCNCIWTTDYNGVKSILCTGKEGTEYAYNSVFFPAAGYYSTQLYDEGITCNYWSSTPSHMLHNYDSAMRLKPTVQMGSHPKTCASIRPVLK